MNATAFPPDSAPGTRDRRESGLSRVSFADLCDFEQDDDLEAFQVFARSCAAIEEMAPPLRRGAAASAALKAIAAAALRQVVRKPAQARRFFGGQPLHTTRGYTDTVWFVAFSPDWRTLASGGGDGTIRLWDAASGELLRTLTGHTNWVSSVAFSPDGRTLASGSTDTTIKLWDVSNANEAGK